MRLGLCTLNPTVGDITGNLQRMRDAVVRCPSSDCILLPELCVSGYPPRDLLTQEGFLGACEQGVRQWAQQMPPGCTIIVGLPMRRASDGACTNSLLVLRDGRVTQRYDKQLLPTYDVFDEDRYFEPGSAACVIDVPVAGQAAPTRLGLTICEDLWMGEDAGFASRYAGHADPVAALVRAGASLIVSASASPFVLGKGQRHRDILSGHASRHAVPVVSVNQAGANDELIFDAHRYVFDGSGALVASGRLFDETPLCVTFAGARVVSSEATTHSPPSLDEVELLYEALVTGIRDYLAKTGFSRALLGLSGGIDSALTAALAVAALGPQQVRGVAMPGPYSSEHSLTDALALARNLGMACDRVPITGPMDGFRGCVDAHFASVGAPRLGEKLPDLTEENLQSRIRGTLLMTLSNRTGALVLTTGNKSEMAVGYCTLYGDMNGGLAVLSDVTKHWVYALSHFINANASRLPGLKHCVAPPIPVSTLTKAPSAELRPNQTDQDSLPPYDVLDDILARSIEAKHSPTRIAHDTGYDVALVRKIVRMIDLAEYKRRQAAVGLKVTSVAFGSGRRYPIAQGWRGI